MPREKKSLSEFAEAVEANNAEQMNSPQRMNSVDDLNRTMEAEFAAEAVPTVDAMGNPVEAAPVADMEFAAESAPMEAKPSPIDTEFGYEVAPGEVHVDAQRLRDAYKTSPENPENKTNQ